MANELDRIRQASLSPFDITVLTTFIDTGGEFPFYVDRLRPETKDSQIAGMNSLIARDLIEVDMARSSGHRWMLRLTDQGRALCSQLDAMNAKKPIEVQMNGEAPEVKSA